jgi:hypothetical protein
LPPEHHVDAECKFHKWRKFIIKCLSFEETLPQGMRQHFHEMMDNHNIFLFKEGVESHTRTSVQTNDDETEMNFDFERQLEESMRGGILPGGGSAHISVSVGDRLTQREDMLTITQEHRGSQGPQILPLFISDDDSLTSISSSEEDGPRASNNGAPNDATTCDNAATQQENSLSLDEPEAKGSTHRPSDLDLGADRFSTSAELPVPKCDTKKRRGSDVSELQESPQKSVQRRLRSQRLVNEVAHNHDAAGRPEPSDLREGKAASKGKGRGRPKGRGRGKQRGKKQ